MIMKLILTLTVIAIAWLVVRNRQQRMQAISHQGRADEAPRPARNPLLKWGAYLLLVMLLLGSGFFLYTQWRDLARVVTVTVVDTQTGRSVSYQARRGDIEERHFITLDGREVNVANSERIELESASPGRP
ncbi:MAG: antitermination protein NusG [gamma proteobacterium symbiont of Ctena orbiculata]|nr:antitermination protein NusG [Candidatus Thiodiazotropha sp. (ex Lucina pensylvanica)]MBT3063622.1 antitermination protein NusG [Candidatus Thiodiazotropha sp. (ex Lucina pensylvanica)]MBV2095939.1 antitermination protein NusG [Candidatus Thiodiazotropha sp. (ex Codakia orbicularis)]PUB73538.1 MAG: antitermination protein NusG [gamma proteobacterium symbiont of Ctena orbiculata]PUB78463.1 MAG: antitermination protein NusG [gamma proteobacterium symbiont of Ctena orbiculata]